MVTAAFKWVPSVIETIDAGRWFQSKDAWGREAQLLQWGVPTFELVISAQWHAVVRSKRIPWLSEVEEYAVCPGTLVENDAKVTRKCYTLSFARIELLEDMLGWIKKVNEIRIDYALKNSAWNAR